ncbi:hypothetical protein FOL47_008965 [Perkinsus chesapeaki]|uniref:Calmodulin n=1 Tax=Perkinsus chesapeaki TaxID=330153 RepID=A0A7J6N1W0_PERCH|nr:hypothetical protein FOL47_008965 [Perkinsus chesapeaki]
MSSPTKSTPLPGAANFKGKQHDPLFYSSSYNQHASHTMQSRVNHGLDAESSGVRGLLSEEYRERRPEPPAKFDTERLKRAFDVCDLDLSGILTKDKMRHILALLGHALDDETTIDTMLEMADCDGDGQVTWDDFATLFRNPARALERADAREARMKQKREEIEKQHRKMRNQQQEWIVAVQEEKMPDTEENKLLGLFTQLTGSASIRPSDLKHMYKLFKDADTDNSGELELDEFMRMFPGEDAALVQRMFDLFDTDGSGSIELKEFIIGLSSLSSVSTVDKVKFAFNLYDLDNSGFLDYGELLQLLTAAQAGMGKIKESDVRARAREVYSKLGILANEASNGDDELYPPLSFEQFVSLARESPQLLLPAHAITKRATKTRLSFDLVVRFGTFESVPVHLSIQPFDMSDLVPLYEAHRGSLGQGGEAGCTSAIVGTYLVGTTYDTVLVLGDFMTRDEDIYTVVNKFATSAVLRKESDLSIDSTGLSARSTLSDLDHERSTNPELNPGVFACTVGKRGARAAYHLADCHDVVFLLAKCAWAFANRTSSPIGGSATTGKEGPQDVSLTLSRMTPMPRFPEQLQSVLIREQATQPRVRADLMICLLCIFSDFLGDNLLVPSYAAFLQNNLPPGLEFGVAASVMSMTYLIGKAICPLYFSSLSDFFGRWSCLVVSSFFTAVGFLLQALAWDFWTIVAFRILTGLAGGTRSVSIVYISDWVKSPRILAFWMSWVSVTQSIAMTIGPLFGGLVVSLDPKHPFNAAYVAFVLNALSFLMLLIFVRKTPYDTTATFWRSRRGVKEELVLFDTKEKGSLSPDTKLEGCSSLVLPRSAGPRVQWIAILPLLLAFGLSNGVSQAWSVILVTVQSDLAVSPLMIGLLGAWCGIWIMFGQLVVFPLWLNKLKWSIASLMIFGFAVSAVIIILAFVENLWAVSAVGAIFSAAIPLAKTGAFSLFPQLCDASVKGRLFGVFSAVSNGSKAGFMLLVGALHDVSYPLPYIGITASVVFGVLVSVTFLLTYPKAARRQKCLNVEMHSAKFGREICQSQSIWTKSCLVNRFCQFHHKCHHNMVLLPFGEVSVAELSALSHCVARGYWQPQRNLYSSESVLIPPILVSFLGQWASQMFEAHGLKNWNACLSEIEFILDIGLPCLPLGGAPHEKRVAELWGTISLHEAAHKLMAEKRIEKTKSGLRDQVKGAFKRLRMNPARKPTFSDRLALGKNLSSLLVRKGYVDWTYLFSEESVNMTKDSSQRDNLASAVGLLAILVDQALVLFCGVQRRIITSACVYILMGGCLISLPGWNVGVWIFVMWRFLSSVVTYIKGSWRSGPFTTSKLPLEDSTPDSKLSSSYEADVSKISDHLLVGCNSPPTKNTPAIDVLDFCNQRLLRGFWREFELPATGRNLMSIMEIAGIAKDATKYMVAAPFLTTNEMKPPKEWAVASVSVFNIPDWLGNVNVSIINLYGDKRLVVERQVLLRNEQRMTASFNWKDDETPIVSGEVYVVLERCVSVPDDPRDPRLLGSYGCLLPDSTHLQKMLASSSGAHYFDLSVDQCDVYDPRLKSTGISLSVLLRPVEGLSSAARAIPFPPSPEEIGDFLDLPVTQPTS